MMAVDMMAMSAEHLIIQLNEAGIQLTLEGNQLKLQAKSAEAVTTELRQLLRDNKETLINYLKGDDIQPVITRMAKNMPPLLSFAQQRLWFLDQLEPNSAFYNIPMLIQLVGQLDVMALEQSFAYLIERHESLRTTFDTIDGTPMQVIHTPAPFTLPVITADDEKQAQQLGQTEATTPFNLREGPLLRVQLLKRSETEHWLLITLHHIISDGWSTGVLLKELNYAYIAYSQGQRPTLPPLPIQYVDFAVWQREYLKGHILDRQLSFWREQLTGAPALLELPTDRLRPPVQNYRGALYVFQLDATLTGKIKQLAQIHEATLFMVLLAAFKVLLARYSRQTDIVVGTPIANRNHAEVEGLIGFFVNTLVLRTHLDDNPTFTTLLAKVRQNTLTAYDHQDLPFEQLVDELQLERTLSYSPLFQTMLILQNASASAFTLPNLTATLPLPAFPFAKFDLTLNPMESEVGLEAIFEYSTNLFDETSIARMAGHFEVLLHEIAARPDQPVLQIPMLTAAEYHQIVHKWNDTYVDFGEVQTIHALFEQQVTCTPDAVAVVMDAGSRFKVQGDSSQSETLNYAELNARANQLAHRLIELGVQPDTLVAVAMERSLAMVVSLLAVLKAGGAYIPIDPTYPSERIAYMLADSAAPILLTQSHIALTQEARNAADHVIAVDQVREQLASYPTYNPQTLTTPVHLLYVIYTSGSTGTPKGAGVYHHNFANLLYWFTTAFGFTANDNVLLISSLNFDLTQKNIFAPLVVGGCLHLVNEYDPEQILKTIYRHQISWINCTPSAFYPLIECEDNQSFRQLQGLRYLFLGGEPITITRLQPWMQDKAFTAKIVNTYGPTECTDIGAAYVLEQGFTNRVVPIGSPIYNVHLLILDHVMQPTPIGIAGELWISGAGLGSGYLNRPELTAERFIEHPEFGRLYKTGDLCRWLSDGNIEYIGRTDFQVKIRGFRIELGEIESALLAQDGVQAAVVMAREDNPGEKRLVAYFVGEAKANMLREHLAQRLPDYMLPLAFVALQAMPLTPNGKLDRRALPVPDYVAAQTTFVAPRNAIEVALAQIFAAVLRIPDVSIHDNFFHIGGDSILSIQVVSRTAQQGYSLSVKDMFQQPTVAQLATVIRTKQPQVYASQDAQIGVAPLLPIQRGFLALNQPDMHHFNQSLLLTVKQPIDLIQLETALRSLLCHHDALRFQYERNELGWQQQYLAPKDNVPLAVVDLQTVIPEHRPAEMEAIGTLTQASLNPLNGDLVRVVYFKADGAHPEGTHPWARLLIVIHHLAMDGVSWRILLEDLVTLLEGGQLPAKTSSYRTWVETLQAATQQGCFDTEINSWLDGTVDTPLPLDDPAANNTMGNSHHLTLTLSPTQTEYLLRTLPDLHGLTLDAVVLTALTETLTDWSKQAALRVKFESYGRQELFDTINLNRTVGWFTSVYPLTLPRFTGSAVKRMRYTLDHLRRITDGGIRFGALHDFHPHAAIREQFKVLPTASVVYNYLGQFDSLENSWFSTAQESTGLSVSPHIQRETLLDSNALVNNGQLQINWTVSPQLYRETAESLLATFAQQLDRLITEALANNVRVAIPSEFANVKLSFEQLTSLLNDSTAMPTDLLTPSENDEEF